MKPIKIEWTEGFSTPTRHATDVTLKKTEDAGKSRSGRGLGTYEVRVGDVVIGTIESREVTLYRKVGRLSNPSGRAVRWSWHLRAGWSDAYSTSGFSHVKREDALTWLCQNAARAKVITRTEVA